MPCNLLRTSHFLLFVILSVGISPAMASNPSPVDQRPASPPPSQEVQLKKFNVGPYLGLRLDTLPNELAAQLPEDVLLGQGILVTGFADDSSAEKQGIKLYDILLNFDKQALSQPQTFIQLVKNSKIGREVTLTLVRQGKTITLPITINSQKYPLDEDQLDYQYNLQVLGYDGYIVKQLAKNVFEVSIRYLAPDGVVRRHNFRGRYEYVMRDINGAPFLSSYAKQKLSQLVSKRKSDEDGWFGDMMPFSDGNFF